MNQRKRHGLNRGLSALFEESGTQGLAERVGSEASESRQQALERTEIAIDLIDPNPRQPRKRFPEEELGALARSIAAHGIVQPLLLRPSTTSEGRYEIVAGERRWRAAQRAGEHAVPVRVQEFSEDEMLQVALVENLQRSDLNPVEEARGYEALLDEFNRTQLDVAEVVGKSRAHIANMVRLLQLPDGVLAMLEDGALTIGHARPLIGNVDAESLARKIVTRKLSVREAEALAGASERRKPKTRQTATPKDPDTLEMEESLSAAVGSKVAINDRNGRGEIRIVYADYEELDRIAGRLSA